MYLTQAPTDSIWARKLGQILFLIILHVFANFELWIKIKKCVTENTCTSVGTQTFGSDYPIWRTRVALVSCVEQPQARLGLELSSQAQLGLRPSSAVKGACRCQARPNWAWGCQRGSGVMCGTTSGPIRPGAVKPGPIGPEAVLGRQRRMPLSSQAELGLGLSEARATGSFPGPYSTLFLKFCTSLPCWGMLYGPT
ncbi:hypothetical protein B0H11DRAFT_2435942 [Mycena galericulata]|nr:hypothetical protein B0H11DRAFT_2435942 [Mycena galericulata]